MKTILCLLICLTTSLLRADYTYVWSGNDARFSGSFSIADSDFFSRAFANLTAVNFQFHDSQNPSYDVTLNNILDVYGGLNDCGSLTSDGLHLDHSQNKFSANRSFWVAAWQYPSIDVGLYSWNPTGDSLEYFEYWANNTVVGQTTGTWSLLVVTMPSNPHVDRADLSGTNFVASGSGGVTNGTYYVLSSTNVSLPHSNWIVLATNAFDGNGHFAFTNAMLPSLSQCFYTIRLP